jgi:hypothetical protein
MSRSPEETVVEESREVRRGFDPVSLALLVLAVAVRWIILRATHSTTEDFLITLRYAENLAAGRGFVYNPGEPVLGTTTPLYALLLGLASVVRLDATTVGKSLNILADGITVWLICRIAARLGHARSGWLGGLLYATTSTPISVSIGGMETALVTCAGMAVLTAFVEKRPGAFAASSALLFLLRIDGLLLVAILGAAWALQQRRGGLAPPARLSHRSAVLFLALTLPWVLFATAYFGSPLPASMLAKLAVYERIRPGVLPNLGEFRLQFAAGPLRILLTCLFVVGAFHTWVSHKSLRAALAWTGIYYAAMLVSRVPAFGWYFLPPLPLYNLCIGLGLAIAVRRVGVRVGHAAAVAGLVAMALPFTWHLRSITRDIASAQRLEDEVRRPLGQWLAFHADTGDTIMLEPIGYIGYYSRLRVLDMIGLVSPEVISCYHQPEENPLVCIVQRYRPEWLILRAAERRSLDAASRAPHEGGSGKVLGEYLWVRGFPDSANGPAFEVYRRAAAPGRGYSRLSTPHGKGGIRR